MANVRKWRGYTVILGGILVHLTLGTVYTFGNLTPYLTSYLRANSGPSDLRYGDSVWIFATAFIGLGLSMVLGGWIHRYLGPRWTTLLGSVIMSGGVLLTSIAVQHSFISVIFTYGLMVGLGVGIAYPIPMATAMKWFPKRKGLASGCVVAGFGGGALVFGLLQTTFINPENRRADEHVDGNVYFTQSEVLDNVPNTFFIFGLCYIVLQIIGSLLVIDPPVEQVNEDSKQNTAPGENVTGENQYLFDANQLENDKDSSWRLGRGSDEHAVLTPREMLQHKTFYILWFVFLFNGQGMVFFFSMYKAYGQTFIEDDTFLAWVGAFASIFNAGGRMAWGYFADRASFKVAMVCLCSLFTILMLTVVVTPLGGKYLFAIYVCLMFGTFSGNYSLFPVAISRSFGQLHYPLNYGLLFTAEIITQPIGATLASQVRHQIGWYGMFFIESGFCFLSLVLMVSCFRLKNPEGGDI